MASSPKLQRNIHIGLSPPLGCKSEDCTLIKGDYDYYHYICDGQDDRGWGCGYRTLQTLCSWVHLQHAAAGKVPAPVPSLPDIQQALVSMQDKAASFCGSKQWIGSVEVAMVVDYLYDEPCKILHIPSGADLSSHVDTIKEHFSQKGSPIMMGGDSDNSSKGIIGICCNENSTSLLILDPHYFGDSPSQETLTKDKFLIWRDINSFMDTSFYNLCLCQHSPKTTEIKK